jgi:hypothetical protein
MSCRDQSASLYSGTGLRGAGFIAAFELADKLDRADARWTLRRLTVPSMTGAELLRAIRQEF